jgi:hypothetical protein
MSGIRKEGRKEEEGRKKARQGECKGIKLTCMHSVLESLGGGGGEKKGEWAEGRK